MSNFKSKWVWLAEQCAKQQSAYSSRSAHPSLSLCVGESRKRSLPLYLLSYYLSWLSIDNTGRQQQLHSSVVQVLLNSLSICINNHQQVEVNSRPFLLTIYKTFTNYSLYLVNVA